MRAEIFSIESIDKYSWKIFGLILLIFLLAISTGIGKHFVLDEVSFVSAAEAINQKGIPVFYEGEEAKEKLGLWHPPLYIYLLAVSFRIFGAAEWSARLVSLVFSLGTLILVYMVSLELFEKHKKRHFIALLSSAIFAFNPMVVQGSLLIDIDNSILPFLIMLFILIFIKYYKTNKIFYLCFLSLIFFLSLWAKLPTPPLAILAVLIFYLLKKDFRNAVYSLIFVGIIGALLFLLTWAGYATALGLPITAPFEHLFARTIFISPLRLLLKILWGFKNLAFWVTPFFFIILAVFIYQRFKKPALRETDFLLLLGLLILIEYSLTQTNAYFFPKYYLPAIPIFSVIIGFTLCEHLKTSITKKDLSLCLAISLLVFSFYFLAMKDPLLPTVKEEFEYITYTNQLDLFIRDTILDAVIFISPMLFIFALLKLVKNSDVLTAILASAMLALLISSVYIDVTQIRADYSTTYNYGEKGLLESAAYVKNHTKASDIIAAEIDVGYYADRPYFRPGLYNYLSDKFLNDTVLHDMRYLVFRSNDLWNRDAIAAINSKYELVAEIGSFSIFKKIDK